MLDLSLHRLTGQLRWRPAWARPLLVAGCLVLGLVMARLPVLWAALGLLIVILITLTLIDPLFGLSVALVLGPSKPVTDLYLLQLPLDLGQIALIVTLGAWALHALRRRRIVLPDSPLNVPMFIFIGAASLSLLGAASLGDGLKELIKWLQMLVVMWLVIDLDGQRRWRFVVGGLIGAGVVQALIGAWQFALAGNGPENFLIPGTRFYRAYGTFQQPNPFGGFLGLVAPVALGLALAALSVWIRPLWEELRTHRPLNFRRLLPFAFHRSFWRLLALGGITGLLYGAIVMSWSRGAWMGVAAALVIMLFAWPRRVRWGLVLVVLAAVGGFVALRFNLLPGSIASRLTGFTAFFQSFDVRGVGVNNANFAVIERLAHWQAAEQMGRYHFWLGVGFGNYAAAYPTFSLVNWPDALGHAHNIYLNLLAETGIIGLCAYAILWISVLWQTWRATRQSGVWQRSLAMGLLGAWTHFSVHQVFDKLTVANLHLHLGVLLGLLSILILSEKRLDRD